MRDALLRLLFAIALLTFGFWLAGYSHQLKLWAQANFVGPIGWSLLGYATNIALTDLSKKWGTRHAPNKD